MRKMCAKRDLWVSLAAIAVVISQTLLGTTTSAQSTTPLLLPRLSLSDISYAGGFRVPAQSTNGQTFARGGQVMAFNPGGSSLFISNPGGRVAEVSIPAPTISSDVNAMAFARYLQSFSDPTEGQKAAIGADMLGGLIVVGNRLCGTAYVYYDADPALQMKVSHYCRSLNLSTSSFSGWSTVAHSGGSGFVSGWMSHVPSEWQSRLGGPMLTGQCCIPIVSRTSWGPAAFAFDSAAIGQSTVGASPLVYYTGQHPTLGSWSSNNDTYGQSTEVGGLVIVAGTRTALYFGRNGTGPACYGSGTADRALVGTIAPDGAAYCYDPTSPYKGVHAYPYRYQIWAYDLNDFADVKAGIKQPWEVVPYGVWPFSFPTQEARVIMGGVGYDAATQTIYVAQSYADTDGAELRPIIHALRVSATGQALPPPAPTPTQVTAVSIASNATPPQPVGTTIGFTATAVGGTAPLQYKWMSSTDGVSWSSGNWSPSTQFAWTPTTANPNHQIRVWARSGTNTANQAEAIATVAFPVGGASSGTVTSVTLSANRTAPQPPGTVITLNATASGGAAPNQFKWMVFDGTTSKVVANWSTSSQFAWTPAEANTKYEVRVWARNASSTADVPEASAFIAFPIQVTGNSSGRVSSVAITANKAEPQPIGSAITWSAVATGGTAPLVYKWWVSEGSAWNELANWGPSATFVWTPVGASPNFRVRVWVKAASNPANQAEASAEKGFAITGPAATPPVVTPPTAPAPKASLVTISSDKPSPQAVGTAVVFTAKAVGGLAPYEYRWQVFDGEVWTPVGGWSGDTFRWVPSKANSKYQVGAWVRSAGSKDDRGEANEEVRFVIVGK